MIRDGMKRIEQAIKDGTIYESDTPRSPSKGRTLLVFVPGWTLKPRVFSRLLLSLVQEEFLRDCDLMAYQYDNGITSNADPSDIALDLSRRINEKMETRGYESIYLMGHSIGALIVRAAVLAGIEESHTWIPAISRLVLLAGTNRGFMPGTPWQRFGAFFVSFFNLPVAKLIMSTQRGSTWVTSLRIGWLRIFGGNDKAPPEIVQLYGTEDLVVAADDASEINRYDNAYVKRIPSVDHAGFTQIDRKHPAYPDILDAFTRSLKSPGAPRQKKRDALVFLIHGIRDFAEWQYALDYEIEKIEQDIEVIPVQYGYFNILQFLLPHQQKRAVRIFVDKYVQETSLSPRARVMVAAHSNGTRVFQQAVLKNDFIKVDRVYFAGSVLPIDIRWSEPPYRERVAHLRNVRANKDVPVGVLCNALKWVPIFGRGLGTAGYHGFKDRAIDNRVLAGGHGAALMPNHREYVARYLVGEEQSQTGKKARASFLMDIISTAAPYALFVLIAGIVGVYVAITATPVGIAVFLSFIVTWLLLLLLQRI